MKPGINCAANYNPKYTKLCGKCNEYDTHHEFDCKKYYKRAQYKCSKCKRGYHYADECKETRSRSTSRENKRVFNNKNLN